MSKKKENCNCDHEFAEIITPRTQTMLLGKQHSPMIIRKTNRMDFPLYIGIICDCDLDDLDVLVNDFIDERVDPEFNVHSIQTMRNFSGMLSDWIKAHYEGIQTGSVEGVAIIFYVDKLMVSSLRGDFMNHDSCRRELYECINIMTKI